MSQYDEGREHGYADAIRELEMPFPLDKFCKLFGWQGGTVHQIVPHVQKIMEERDALAAQVVQMRSAIEMMGSYTSAWPILPSEQKLREAKNDI